MFGFKLDKPDYTINLPDSVVKVELSPFEWSANFALIALPKSVLVFNIDFQEQNGEYKLVDNQIDHYLVQDQPTALAISQECVLTPIMKVIQFACATMDFTIHLIEDGLEDKKQNHNCYFGHTNFINDITFDRMSSADILASVSDDRTCRIWSLKQLGCVSIIHLSSPGMAVRLGSDSEVLKLIVAQKNGLINIYGLPTGTLISCFQTMLAPLMDMDWSIRDPHSIAAIANDYLLMWDLSRKCSFPSYKEPLFYSGNHVRYSNVHNSTLALITKPSSTLSISKLKIGNMKASIKLPYATNVTWHSRLPYICLGCNDKLVFWKIP